MVSQLRGPDDDAYRLLTEKHTLLVLDTETTPAAGGGPQRLIQLGTVTIRYGRRGRASVRLVDPCEPITNSHIHGLTANEVRGQPDFSRVVPALDALLRGAPGTPPVVLVAHYANYDVEVLRGEYARLGRSIPDIPVLDTMALTGYVGHDTGRSRSLLGLARSLDIEFTVEHDAGKDATATAKCLVALLRIGARAGLVDLDHILSQIGSSTSTLSPPNLATRQRVEAEPELADDHLATHSRLLPAQPTPTELDAWLAGALECIQLRCPLARDRAASAVDHAPEHAGLLLQSLTTALAPAAGQPLTPGQGATLAAALAELIPTALPKATAAVRWWRAHKTEIAALPRCSGGLDRCPDCRDAEPCPLDTLRQVIATTEAGFSHDGHLPNTALNRLTQTTNGTLWTWVARGDIDVAGYAAWAVYDYLDGQGATARATAVLDRAIELGMGAQEPRLALAHAQALLNQGQFDTAADALAWCPRPPGNTDTGYTQLTTWAAGPYAESLARRRPPRPRVRTLPRQARPTERVRPNRFKR